MASNKKTKGGSGNDVLTSGPADDDIDGGAGLDTVIYSGAFLQYGFTRGKNEVVVTDLRPGAPDGVDTLKKVEVMQFTDRIIYLDGRNNAPHAVGDSAAGTEDNAIIVVAASLLVNDGDFDSDAISLANVGGAINGTVALNVAGNVVFTPNADFNGTAGFTYQVQDAALMSHPATVIVAIAAVNDAPAGAADTAAAVEDSAGSIIDVLANDVAGPANESAQALIVLSATAQHGSVVINPNGTIAYTPDSDYTGPDTISYTIQDNGTTNGVADNRQSSSTVAVTVIEVNDAPVANDDTLSSVAEDSGTRSITFEALTGNDSRGPVNESGQSLTITTIASAFGGIAAIVDGQIQFTPEANFAGTASFHYTVSDNGSTNGAVDPRSDVGHVSFNVTAVNDAPVANPDTLDAIENVPITYTASQILSNDTDVDSSLLTLASVTSGTGGTAAFNGDGTVSFTPAANFNGAATFSYMASDGTLTSNSATATVNVAAVNRAPTVAVSPLQVTIEETENRQSITAAVLLGAIGASDIDGDALRIVNFRLFGPDGEVDPDNLPPGVTLEFANDGSFTLFSFDPRDFSELTAGESRQIRLEFDVVDGQGGSVHDVAELTIVGVADINRPAIIGEPPLRDVTEDSNVAAGNLSTSGVIPFSDPDPGQSSLSTIVVPAAGNKGILSLQPHGAYTYIVQNGTVQYLGVGDVKVDSFTISAFDGTTRQVQFTVHGVNDRVVIPHQPANPSFEQIGAAVPFGGTLSLAGGSSVINGWTVTGAGIDFARNGYQGSRASDGGAFIDLAGSTPLGSYAGGVTQVVGTIPGSRYFVQFDMSGNPDGRSVERIRVTGGSDTQDYAFDTAGRTWTNLGWREEQFIFNASGASTPLSFTSLTGDFMGPLLDNVRLTPIHRVVEAAGTPITPMNPSFEQVGAVVPPGGTLSLAGGSSILTGWTVTGAGIDFARNGYQSSQGSHGGAYIDLSGSTLTGSYAGGVRQFIDTVPGARYRVQFDMSGNPDGGSVETIRVSAGSGVSDYSFDTAGRSWTNLGWREEQFIFTASGASTPLSFSSLSGDFMGPLLDNVRVSPMIGGTIGFLDADVSDDGDHNVGSAFVGDPLSQQFGTLTAFVANDTTNGIGGSVRWDYSVDPRAIEFLAAGERRLEKFKLTIDDGHFAGDASQYVLVDLVGANDDPTIGSGTFSASLVTPLGVPGVPFEITRGFGFLDVDVSDTHGASAMFNAALSSGPSPLGSLTAEIVGDTINGQGGLGRWRYVLDPQVANVLTPGELFTDGFDLVLSDSSGGTARAQVIITIGDAIANMSLEPQAGPFP